jgi:hypothetical protein
MVQQGAVNSAKNFYTNFHLRNGQLITGNFKKLQT